MEKDSKENEKKNFHIVNGLPITTIFSAENIQQTISFKLKPDDIIIAGFPKSGTTWTQYIVWEIVNEGAPLPSVNDIWCKEVPHLEMTGTNDLEHLKSPRLFKILLPFNFTPYHPSAKYIYVARNPWDCCISAFNHFRQVDKEFSDCTFDEYFECFMKGEVSHGDYFDYLLSWYTRWNDPNFLFVTYEDMKRDVRSAVLKIAKFLGEKYYEILTNNKEMFETILRQIQFEYMKENCIIERSKHSNNVNSEDKVNFFKSGRVGDWRKYFSVDQKDKLKKKFLEKFNGTDLLFLWKNSEIFLD